MLPYSRAFLFLASALLACAPVQAITDLNGNGISDVWEFTYRYDSFFYPPSADTDGDGASNVAESAFGSDPFNPYSFGPDLGIAFAGVDLAFSFPSRVGLRYQLLGTATLGTVPWSSLGTPIAGTGAPLSGTVSGPFADRYFLRLEMAPRLDQEADGLDAFEEYLLGSSDATATTDADILTDLEEFQMQSLFGLDVDPTKEFTLPGVRDGTGDDDRDGVNDLDEFRGNSDPTDPASFPAGHPNIDSDQDGLRDAFEIQYFGNITVHDAVGNPDNDRLTNEQEQALNLNPMLTQTNGTRDDGLSDQDNDNIIDLWELEDRSDPFNASSVDLATNFVVLQGFMEHKSAWGAVSDSAAQFSGVTLRAQAIGFENAQPTTGSLTYGLKNDVVAPFVNNGGGNYSVSRSMRFRKNVRYQVDLLNPNNVNAMPFVSGKYNWVSGGNADELTNTYFNYEVASRQWYNRDPSDTVSPIFAIATDAALSPNPDVNNVHFTQKGPGSGGPDATLYPTGALTLKPLQFISADGPTAGAMMRFLPIYEPNDGIGKGQPIYDAPNVDLQLSAISAAQLTAEYLGVTHTLTVSPGNPLLYENAAAGLSILLSEEPLGDANVVESLSAWVSRPAVGITNAFYVCAETSASSALFENEEHGLVGSLTGLDLAVTDTLTVEFVEENFSRSVTLNETAVNSRQFTGEGFTITVVNGSTLTGSSDVLYLAITSPGPAMSNTVFALTETSGTSLNFRNFDPAISTDGPAETPDGASFYLRTLARLGGSTNTPTMKIRVTPSAGGGSPGAWMDIPMVESTTPGVFQSQDKLVLVPPGTPATSGYLNIPVVLAQLDFSNEQKEIEVEYGPAFDTNKGQPEAIVLQSLDRVSKFGQGLDPDERFRKPLQDFGYKVYYDYDAKTNTTIDTYAPGKQIWYSMSHGSNETGSTLFGTAIPDPFLGLAFIDSETAGLINRERLAPKNLNYRMVLACGCISAQSSQISRDDARRTDTLITETREFAEVWGPKAAYLGWGWQVNPKRSELDMAHYLALLKRFGVSNVARTVKKTHDRIRRDLKDGNELFLLKLHVNGGFSGDEDIYIIDRKASNAKQ